MIKNFRCLMNFLQPQFISFGSKKKKSSGSYSQQGQSQVAPQYRPEHQALFDQAYPAINNLYFGQGPFGEALSLSNFAPHLYRGAQGLLNDFDYARMQMWNQMQPIRDLNYQVRQYDPYAAFRGFDPAGTPNAFASFQPGQAFAGYDPRMRFGNLPKEIRNTSVAQAASQAGTNQLGVNAAADFLQGGRAGLVNPEISNLIAQAVQAGVNPVVRAFSQQIQPGIAAQAWGAGQSGSSRQGIAEGIARSNLQQQALDSAMRTAAQLQARAYDSGLGAYVGTLGQLASLQNAQTGSNRQQMDAYALRHQIAQDRSRMELAGREAMGRMNLAELQAMADNYRGLGQLGIAGRQALQSGTLAGLGGASQLMDSSIARDIATSNRLLEQRRAQMGVGHLPYALNQDLVNLLTSLPPESIRAIMSSGGSFSSRGKSGGFGFSLF